MDRNSASPVPSATDSHLQHIDRASERRRPNADDRQWVAEYRRYNALAIEQVVSRFQITPSSHLIGEACRGIVRDMRCNFDYPLCPPLVSQFTSAKIQLSPFCVGVYSTTSVKRVSIACVGPLPRCLSALPPARLPHVLRNSPPSCCTLHATPNCKATSTR